MCWWTDYGTHIKDDDDCRNIVAFIFNQYTDMSGTRMQSVSSNIKNVNPHTIDHDERCEFAAMVATIVGEPPKTEFDKTVAAVKKLKKYRPKKKDIKDSAVLSLYIIAAMEKHPKKYNDDYQLADDTKVIIRKFAAAVCSSMRAYLSEIKITHPYSMEYVHNVLN